jgi:hypothetical protein
LELEYYLLIRLVKERVGASGQAIGFFIISGVAGEGEPTMVSSDGQVLHTPIVMAELGRFFCAPGQIGERGRVLS